MSKLYNIHQLKNKEIVELISHFFENVNEYDEFCKDEAINLLNLYFEYFMRKHCMDTSSFRSKIHAEKISEDDGYAYVITGTKNDYDVYLDKDLMHTTLHDKNIYEKIVYLLVDAGHEFYHIIQNQNHVQTYEDLDTKTELALNAYKKNVTSLNKKRLKHHINNYLTDLTILHPTEIEADTMSTKTLLVLLDELIDLNKSNQQANSLISLFNVFKILVNTENKSRQEGYKRCLKSESYVKKYLETLNIELTI